MGLQEDIYSDIHGTIALDAQGRIRKATDVESVMTSIDNILRTRPTERVFLRSFGSRLTGLLFENMDEAYLDALSDEIKETIQAWDDRPIINTIGFKAIADTHEIEITLSFAIRGYSNIFTHTTRLSGV